MVFADWQRRVMPWKKFVTSHSRPPTIKLGKATFESEDIFDEFETISIPEDEW